MTAAEHPAAAPSLADAVNARLAELEWSRNRLANAVGVEHPTITRLCDGKTERPHPETVQRIERALGLPAGDLEDRITRTGAARGVPPGPRRRHSWRSPSAPPAAVLRPVPEHQPRNVMHLDVPPVTTAPLSPAAELALPDPALRWRSPRNLAGRVEQVERWTYALAVARILVKEAETPA